MSETIPTLSATEVQSRLSSDAGATLLDVVVPEAYERCHLPGAKNACVYKMSFLEDAEKAVGDKAKPVIVYGHRENSAAATIAAERLIQDGFGDVSVFSGGIEKWQAAGLDLEENPDVSVDPASPTASRMTVDADASVIRWTGRNLASHHTGTIQLKGGEASFQNGALAGLEATIDMKSIYCTDIEDENLRNVLHTHLAHDDFFATDVHPEAVLCTRSIEPITDAEPGQPNLRVVAAFQLRGVTQEIQFEAIGGPNAAGEFIAQAWFDIVRTRWCVNYGSGKIFEALGMHLVHDTISLFLTVALKAS